MQGGGEQGTIEAARETAPTPLSEAVFRAKVTLFQARRLAVDLTSPVPRHSPRERPAGLICAGGSVTALFPETHAGEQILQRGKVHNLRLAAAALDRLFVPAGQLFSFWRQVGPAIPARGYAPGRMLQQGCMVPAIGGGLCQLSNALYDAALQAGLQIVERHAHSRIVPGSAAEAGRDATVAWNYVDLRLRSQQPLWIEARLTAGELVVGLHTPVAAPSEAASRAVAAQSALRRAESCAGCDRIECHRHEGARPPAITHPRTAWLVDENWPELKAYVRAALGPDDILGSPLDGRRLRLGRYRWDGCGPARERHATLEALSRAWAIRRAAEQGPARRRAEIEGAAAIAARLGRLADWRVERLAVAQSLLPHLWRQGVLGGRPFEVLMTRLPMAELQRRLDQAAQAHPERATLADFRAPAWLVEAEAEALAAAERIVTPHEDIARLFGPRAHRLAWQTPTPSGIGTSPSNHGRIAFPGPTVARKGAHAVREAARRLDLTVLLLGSELEGEDFWSGVRTERLAGPGAWLDQIDAVVQPAIVEDQPRRLLAALAAGVPVIASPACGLGPRPGLTLVAADDAEALTQALVRYAGRAAAAA